MIGCDVMVVRFLKYKETLESFKSLGLVKVFSDNLADAAGVSPSLVRKDFSLFNITGRKRGGYSIDNLINRINDILGKDRVQRVVIVGLGRLGTALLRNKRLQDNHIKIVAAFDKDPAKINPDAVIPIIHIEELRTYITENKIDIGIVTIPENSVQQIVDIMILGGIKGILNFTPKRLYTPKHCIVKDVNLKLELENLIYLKKGMERKESLSLLKDKD